MQNHGSSSRLLTVEEVAELLSVTPRFVRHLITTGRLASVRLNGGTPKRSLLRIEQQAVNDFIERGRFGQASAS